ncbi:hypothetical protein Ccrd_007168, partial [Cynara cardunculus var. scolymus]
MDDLVMDTNGLGDGSDIEGDDIRCENIAEKDVSDEEIDAEDLERRMWKDRIKLKRIKEKQKILAQQTAGKQKAKQTSDQARRKKMSRAQDGILKYMLKLMEVCKARGFVYGIIPEKGKPVSGSSDNLRAWWKEKVKFDKNGPAAIAKYDSGCLEKNRPSNSYDSDYDVYGFEDGGAASVSSKDDRRQPRKDAEQSGHSRDPPPPVPDKEQPQPRAEKKRKREKSKPSQEQLVDGLPDINQADVSLVDYPMQENIPEDHPLTAVRPLAATNGTEVQIPPNMLLYPPVQESEYRPQGLGITNGHEVAGVHHGPQSSELHPLVPYSLYMPPIEEQQPVHEFQIRPEYSGVHAPESQPHRDENSNAIPGGFHNDHEQPVDNQFESSINSLSLDYPGFNSPFNLGLDATTSLDPDLDFLLDDDLI